MPMCTTCNHQTDMTATVCPECQTPVDPSIHAYLLAVLDARKSLAQHGTALHHMSILTRAAPEAAQIRTQIARVSEAIEHLQPPPGYESAHAAFRHGTRLLLETFDSLANLTTRPSGTNASSVQRQLTNTMAHIKRSVTLLDHGPTTLATDVLAENGDADQSPSQITETTFGHASENQISLAEQTLHWIARWEDSANTLLEAMRETTDQIAQSSGNRQVRLFQKMASDIIGLREENSALFDELVRLRRDIASVRRELAEVRVESLDRGIDHHDSTDFEGWPSENAPAPRDYDATDISEWSSTSGLLKRAQE